MSGVSRAMTFQRSRTPPPMASLDGTGHMRPPHLERALILAEAGVRHPVEMYDRWRGRSERRRDRREEAPHLVVNRHSAIDLAHELARVRDCATCATELAGIRERISRRLPSSSHHDSGWALGELLWSLIIHTRPRVSIETGVGRGKSTAFILDALNRVDEEGHLWSVDIPPLEPRRYETALAVDEGLRSRWTYVRGTSRRRLGQVLRRVSTVDLFLHDGLHTTDNMLFEFHSIWPRLSSGGFLVVDDAEDNSAFARFADARFAEGIQAAPYIINTTEERHVVGVLQRPG